MFQDRKIKAPSSAEMKTWWGLLSSVEVPKEAFQSVDKDQLEDSFRGIIDIRNGFVHRAPEVRIQAFDQMVEDAKVIAQQLGDVYRHSKFEALHQQLKIIFDVLSNRVSSHHESVEIPLLLPLAQMFGLTEADLQD